MWCTFYQCIKNILPIFIRKTIACTTSMKISWKNLFLYKKNINSILLKNLRAKTLSKFWLVMQLDSSSTRRPQQLSNIPLCHGVNPLHPWYRRRQCPTSCASDLAMRLGSLETAACLEICAAAEGADIGEPPVIKVKHFLSLSLTKRPD